MMFDSLHSTLYSEVSLPTYHTHSLAAWPHRLAQEQVQEEDKQV
jgi:hypothetical protein